MQKPAAFLMVTVLLLGLYLMSESRQGAGAGIDTAFGDWAATNTNRTSAPTPVTLVEIDDASLATEHAWPWSPLQYALFLRGVLPFKPDVVAIEPVLNWQDVTIPGESREQMDQYRAALHDCILQAPKLVLASQLGAPDDTDTVPPLQPVPLLPHVSGDTKSIPAFADVAGQAEESFRLSATAGFTNLPAAEGEIVRKAPLIFKYRDDEIVPSFVLQTLIQWFKLTPDDVKVESGVRIVLGKAATIPIDTEGRMDVDFSSAFTRLGENDLLLAVSEQQHGGKIPATIRTDTLKGGIALLARTDADSRTLTIPSQARESRGEICAAAIATVLNHAYSRRVSHVFDFTVIAAMMALSCFFHRFTKRTFALISFMALLFYLFLGMSVYSLALVRLPFLLPVGLLLLMNFFSSFSPRGTPAPAAPAARP